ncbi:transglycosylase family protein [Kitasatospora azatica]|uniref:transglycosylase family protein n=1 Tax=Kitasatospora azatica TaxID=58347 RepID=UPI000690B97D|nr:transglycosylase family protein [Kitasatospora azatica]
MLKPARRKYSLALAAASLLAVVAPVATAGTASAASVSTWDKVAQCESSGDWSIVSSGTPTYYGGLQFSASTWSAYGGTQYAPQANLATKQQQILIGEKALASQGQSAWPKCGPLAGLGADTANPYPSTAAPSNVQLDIVGADGAQYSQFGNYGAGAFNPGWTNVGGASITKITSVNVGGDLVHFYAVAGGRVFGQDHIPSQNRWTGWAEIPGGASSVKDIAASANGNNVILSIIGGDGVLYTQYGNYDQGHFDQSWTTRNGANLTSITSVTGNSNTIRIYAVGYGGRVYGEDFTLSSNSVGGWGEIPGGALGVKDIAGSMNGNNVVLSIVGADGVLYTQYANYDQGHFDPNWTTRNGAGLTNLTTVNGDSNTIHIYAIGAGGHVYGEDFTLSTNNVGGWGEIPGGAVGAKDITASNSN